MKRSLTRSLLILVAAFFLAGSFAQSADAQRRRRRRRAPPPPPPVEQVETPDEPPAEGQEAGVTPGSDTGEEGAEGDGGLPPPVFEGATEEPSSTPTAEYDPGPVGPDVTPIRTEYVALMDDLVQARNRVSALGSELFRTRMTLTLQDRTGANTTLARIAVHVDGAPVFQNSGAVEGADAGREIFTGALAPGPHVITLEVEQRARDDDDYRYTLEESFRFQVARERLSEATIILEDSSDIARAFAAGGEGRYEVRTRLRVAARALPTAQ